MGMSLATQHPRRKGEMILPLFDNSGAPLVDVHCILVKQMTAAFDGFTMMRIHGGWRGDDGKSVYEEGVLYAVAAEPTAENNAAWLAMAENMRITAQQAAIYVMDFNGDVHFVRSNTEGENDA